MPESLLRQLHFHYPAQGTTIHLCGDGWNGVALVEEYLEVFRIVKVAPGLKPEESPQLGEARKIRQASSSNPKLGVTKFSLPLDGSRVDGMGS
jgi:hypothetical protein